MANAVKRLCDTGIIDLTNLGVTLQTVTHFGIFDAAVFSVNDVHFGKRLRAFTVSEPGARQDVEETMHYLQNDFARFKVPRAVVFIDKLPRNATGKLLRRILSEIDVGSTPKDAK